MEEPFGIEVTGEFNRSRRRDGKIKRAFRPLAPRIFRPWPAGSITNGHDYGTARMNLRMNLTYCLIDLLGATWRGPYRFHHFSKLALYHPRHPLDQRPGSRTGHRSPRLSASRQDVAHVARVPAAAACCRNTTRVERVSKGVILPAEAGGGGALRRFNFSVFASTGGCCHIGDCRLSPLVRGISSSTMNAQD
jgi:hypothetical protein